MRTELPTRLNVSYLLECSDSYSGAVHQETATDGQQYCTSLQGPFENDTKFILTVECICVGIYCSGSLGFKIFDFHARNLSGSGHSKGTGVLLEVSSLDSLIF